MAKPPRRDEQKLLAEADKALRFEAVLADDVEENENRKFVLQISISDDAVGVWELKQRNSGHSEGKFASKSRKKNPETGTFFKPGARRSHPPIIPCINIYIDPYITLKYP